jgi:hypothetical protein
LFFTGFTSIPGTVGTVGMLVWADVVVTTIIAAIAITAAAVAIRVTAVATTIVAVTIIIFTIIIIIVIMIIIIMTVHLIRLIAKTGIIPPAPGLSRLTAASDSAG